jgi:hypothetical protein
VIVWLNGTFGCGKTTTAAELCPLIPSSRLFDPETVGYMLRSNLGDRPVPDFQHRPPWGPLAVERPGAQAGQWPASVITRLDQALRIHLSL